MSRNLTDDIKAPTSTGTVSEAQQTFSAFVINVGDNQYCSRRLFR